MLFLDLDRFKLVNDSLGHHVGDRLLVAVARRLESALRPGDTVARLGGDEFTLLLDDVCDAREATVIAERVQQTLQDPFHLDGREIVVAASIGIALADPDAAPADVMRDADVAMYRAKAEGKGRHAVFDARMHELVMRRLDLETDLRHAIEDDRIEVAYQPLVQTATGRIVGFEALARWHGPDGRRDRPRRLRADRRGDRADRRARPPRARARVRGAGRVARAAGRRGADALRQRLAPPAVGAQLPRRAGGGARRTRASTRGRCGWRCASTTSRATPRRRGARSRTCSRRSACAGRSTTSAPAPRRCSLLHRFPGDAVKIFGPLVSGMGHDGGSFEIVKAIVELAHNLGLEVIAEGVETAGQLEHLRVLGCEFAQGFHVSAPLAAPDARALLAQGTLVR